VAKRERMAQMAITSDAAWLRQIFFDVD
jgi:hypothetical protein